MTAGAAIAGGDRHSVKNDWLCADALCACVQPGSCVGYKRSDCPEQKEIKLILGFGKLFPVPFPLETTLCAPIFNLSLQNLPLERDSGQMKNYPNRAVSEEA